MAITTVTPSAPRTSQLTLKNGDSLIVETDSSFALSSTAVLWNGGASTIVNNGTINATDGGRGIDTTGTPASDSRLSITVGATGRIEGDNDAIRINKSFNNGLVSLDNSGIVLSHTGQALDINALTSTSTVLRISNYAGGLIKAEDADAIRPGANSQILNYGTIISETTASGSSDGIDYQDFTAGTAIISNYEGGSIVAARHGITGSMGITLDNAGTITGTLGSGINLDNAVDDDGNLISTRTNSIIINYATGVIQGTGGTRANGDAQDGDGVDVDYTVTLENYGKIYAYGASVGEGDKDGSIQEAITVGGGTINNFAGGLIESVQRAITVDNSSVEGAYAATIIYNEGTIRGVDSSIDDYIGAISITGTFADTLTNKGTIEGSVALGGGNDTFNSYTGSTTTGTIDGGDGIDTINLFGTGSSILADIVNFEALNVQGGTWTVMNAESFSSGIAISSGATLQIGNGGTAGAVDGAIQNDGSLVIDRSDTVAYMGITGSGSLTFEGGGTLALKNYNTYSGGTVIKTGTLDVSSSSAVGTGNIQFADGAASTLVIGAGVTLANTITGFSDNDTIDFVGFDAATTKVGFDHATNILSVTDGLGHSQTLQFSGDFSGLTFSANASADGVSIVACYGLGTLIETEAGDVTVESLKIGDLVRTLSGALRPIKWIGTRSYAGRFIAMNRDLLPVCFKAGSLGENALGESLPRRDLLISPHHAMYIDGLLIEARDLVNGVSIVQAPSVERVDYFHIELESHDVIIAEGAPSETFIDDDSRAMFHNAMDYAALYPNEAAVEPIYCAPRVYEGEALEAVRAKIESRAGLANAA